MLSVFYQSCGNDDDVSIKEEGGILFAPESLIGYWYCTYQEWNDNGDVDHSNYKMDSSYYIIFRDDFTGSTHAGKDELMEWAGSRDFHWSIEKNMIDVGYGTLWSVKSISDSELTLQWEDVEDDGEFYRIICKFKKKE